MEAQDHRGSAAALSNCSETRTSHENRESQNIPISADPRPFSRKVEEVHKPQTVGENQRADLKATEDPRHESMKTASEAPRPWKLLRDTDAPRTEKLITDEDAANREMPSKDSDDPQVAK